MGVHKCAMPAALLACTLLLGTSCTRSGEASSEVRTYSMGEKVQVGHLSYTVFDTQWITNLGQGVTARVPERRFLLVRVSVVNSGSGELPVPVATLVSDNGDTHPELSNGEGVPRWLGYLRHVRPAESLQGNLVFDVNPAHYKLRISDETEQKAALIDMPLTFGSEAPDLPMPEQQH